MTPDPGTLYISGPHEHGTSRYLARFGHTMMAVDRIALPPGVAIVTEEGLARALHEHGYCVHDPEERCSGPQAHKYEARALISAIHNQEERP